MKIWTFVFLLLSSLASAQDQLAVRLNEEGLMKIMELALKYNTSENSGRTVVVPQNLYEFVLKQEDLDKNSIIEIINEVSDLNLNEDLKFYLQTSDIKVTGIVDPKSLSTQITNSSESVIDFKVSINLSHIKLKAESMTLCEHRLKNIKKCGQGLKTTVKDLSVVTLKNPVRLSSTMRLKHENGFITIKVLKVSSNLDSQSAPELNIQFKDLEVPRIAIVINNQETELDTSKLKDEILERRTYFGKKLLAFAGEFIAHDLADMINVYLSNTILPNSVQIFHRDDSKIFEEIEYRDGQMVVVNTKDRYVRPTIVLDNTNSEEETPVRKIPAYDPDRFVYRHEAVRDNTNLMLPEALAYDVKPAESVMKVMMDQIASIIHHARVNLRLKTIRTPGSKDIELSGLLDFVLNHSSFNVKDTLGNSNRTLPKLDLSSYRSSHINLAISEPVLNGALDLVNSTGLFQELLSKVSDEDSLSLRNIKIHFTTINSLKVIANVEVDLKKVRTSFWKDPKGWAETEIGEWLERNNNNSVIYFPLELDITPIIRKDPKTGVASLSIKVKSPFKGDTFLNTYKYPSNVSKMYEIVRKGVVNKFRAQLDEYSDKEFSVDLSKYLNQSGVEFTPKGIAFNQAAYLLLNLDIKDIKFNSKEKRK